MSSALFARLRRQPPPASAEAPPQPTLGQSAKAIARSSWLNLLLLFIPVAWAIRFVKPDDDTLIFVFCFLAIIPLAQLLGFATEELSMRVGQTLAGLLNATLGNAVELIVAILALIKCELRVVQSSLIGSILSNLLLVLGMCFFAGGMRFSEQGFSIAATQINSSLLMLSVTALLLPAALRMASSMNATDGSGSTTLNDLDILKISHGVAILLLLIYAGYLVFQLYSHANLYDDKEGTQVPKSVRYNLSKRMSSGSLEPHLLEAPSVESSTTLASPTSTASTLPADVESAVATAATEEKEETPSTSLMACILLLVTVTVLIGVTSEFLVGSIDGLSTSTGLPKEFIGLILLPIVGNAAEHATAVTVSVKDKLTLSCQVAVGSALQIAVFVIPVLVLLAWTLGKPLTLYFDPFEAVTLLLAVLTVNYVVADGKSNWLEGLVLMILYVIIGTTVYFYAGSEPIIACT